MALFGKKKDNMNQPGPAGMPPDMYSGQNDMGQMPPPQDYGQQPQQNPGQADYYGQPMMPPDMNQAAPDMGQMPDMNQMPPAPGQQDYGQPYPDQGMGDAASFSTPQFQPPAQDGTVERVEEIAEAIIDEKWNELTKEINKVIEWKERTDTEIKKIEQEIINLKERFEALHKGVLGKITEYDQNLTNVGTEIKAMEKVFQNLLPTFTENVNKLERMAKGIPSSKGK